jgi:hypothetical protein
MYSEQEAVLAYAYARALLRVSSIEYSPELILHFQHASLFFKKYPVLLWHQPSEIWQKILTIFHCNLMQFAWLIQLLERDHRLALFPQVFCHFVALYKQKNHALFLRIAYSHRFSTEQERIFTTRICSLLNTERVMHLVQVNPELIAGVAVHGDLFSWEHSVRKTMRLYERGIRRG